MVTLLLILSLMALFLGYLFYGKFLEQSYKVKPKDLVPSKLQFDGVDFVPTNRWVLLGHHFSSIAGAGPILGPIIAGLAYGWGPCVLWILIGAIFIGGVHDFSALMASLRHKGKSIAEITKIYMGKTTYKIFLIFIWFTLIYVVTVFTDLAATSFSKDPAVAQINLIYILIAFLLGFLIYKFGIKLPLATGIALFLLTLGIYLCFYLKFVEYSREIWIYLLFLYSFIASVLPVWMLLQPRDYLSSFLLYSVFIVGILGILISKPSFAYPALVGFYDPKIGPIFPFIFITVACGAVSGFHSLVSSGTTSKQLDNIKNARFVGYGGMLLEGFLAILAISTLIMIGMDTANSLKNPIDIFSHGMGCFFESLNLDYTYGRIWGNLVLSAFILTTLDTALRISRYVSEELLNIRKTSFLTRLLTTSICLLLPIMLINLKFYAPDGSEIPVWKKIWPIFGATNQLLASLVLLTLYVWIRRERLGRGLFVLIPGIFMYLVTTLGLFYTIIKGQPFELCSSIASLLLILALYIGFRCLKLGWISLK